MNDFLMQDHDIAELKYDLAEYYHFHVPTTDRADLRTGEDVANWVRRYVDMEKAKETEQWVPRWV